MEHDLVTRRRGMAVVALLAVSALSGCGHVSSATTPTAAAAAADCSTGAVLGDASTLPSAVSFPPAEAAPADLEPTTQEAAVTAAHGWLARFTGAAAPDNTPTTTVETNYQTYVTDNPKHGSGDPRIAPDRCVWVVTTFPGEPFTIQGMSTAGEQAKPLLHTKYTVVTDVASGFVIHVTG